MSMTPLVTVKNTPLPDPSTYEGTTATIVDSARDVNGVMVGGVIRDDVGKVAMTWRFLTVAQWAAILALFSIKQGGSFTNPVTFFCQDTGTWETRTMYVNDRKASIFLRNADGSIKGYQNCSLNLIEV